MSQFLLIIEITADNKDQAEEIRDNMSLTEVADLFLGAAIHEHEPVLMAGITKEAMAILSGSPHASEKELQDLYGNGRACGAVVGTRDDGTTYLVGLKIAKETSPIQCFLDYEWRG